MDMSPKALGPRGEHQYRALGRLKPGVAVAKAQAELHTIAQRLEKQYPDSNEKVGAMVIPLKDQLVGDSRPQLLILLGAVGFVLLIACANVANLLLVRATGRHREIAVRRALGAGRGRIVRQLLTESVLLSLLGALFGLALAWGCVRVLASAESVPIPRPNPIGLDGTVLLFTFAISLLVGILFGLAPALQVSQLQLSEELKASAQAALTPSGRRRLLRDGLVVGEIAVSLALLVGAGLLLRSFARLREVKVGVRPEGVLTTQIVLPPKKYAKLEQASAFFEQLLDGLKNAPGVQAAAIASALPLQGGSNGYVTVEGQEKSAYEGILVEWNDISSDYFRAFGIPFLRGRNFSDQDSRDTADAMRKIEATVQSGKTQAPADFKAVAIINQAMARQFWPQQDPVGRVFKLGGTFPVTVVGIVGDVKEWGIRHPVIPQAYFPLSAALIGPGSSLNIVIKSAGGPRGMLPTVRDKVHSLDSTLALFHVRTMEEIISESMAGTSYQALLLGRFCPARPAAHRSRDLWSDGLRGHAADTRDGHSHGAGRAARRRPGACHRPRSKTRPGRCGPRPRGRVSRDASDVQFAVWSQRQRPTDFRRRGRVADGGGARGVLYPRAPGDEGGPDGGAALRMTPLNYCSLGPLNPNLSF